MVRFPICCFQEMDQRTSDPMMALVLLSDSAPGKATEKVFKRCAYILLPLSVLFIKYYPQLGRGYDFWTGFAFYTGLQQIRICLVICCSCLDCILCLPS